jgi:hypothetical protein
MINGWRETLLCVANIDSWVETYCGLGDWEVRYDGSVAPDMLSFLGVSAAGPARETLLGLRGAEYGMVRLLDCATGTRQPVIRSFGRPWETGGWFDLNARVDNIAAQFERLQDLGWGSVSDPIEYDFGPFTVKEWLAYGPDGVVMALIERINPPLEPDKRPGRLGTHFNSTQIVDDIAAAQRFYQDVLGFTVMVEINDEPMMPQPTPNVLGVPNEIAARQHWNISMLQAPGATGGSIEIISLPGLSGRNFAPLANPPNRGIISHRFPVDDVKSLHNHLTSKLVDIVQPPQRLELSPFGQVQMMTARGPCGVRLDFMQPD